MRAHVTELESRRKASNGHRLPDPIALGEILTDVTKNQWRVGRSIGVGGFGEIYLASDNLTRAVGPDVKYAIKLEPHESGPLFVEINFYIRAARAEAIEEWKQKRRLKGLGMPNFVSFGSHTANNIRYRFLVLERYGTDLDKLFLANGKAFHIKTALTIGIQTLDILEFVHSQGYIHADVKGSNLLLGRGSNKNQVYLLDFGLASQFLESDGTHKEYVSDERKAHMGTIEFTSRDCHIGACSRRGDLEVLGYNMLYWICGKLPWEKYSDSPERVYESKLSWMSNIPELLRICFPRGRPPSGLIQYFHYIAKLDFSATPDYNFCRKLLRQEIKNAGYVDDGFLEFSDFSAIAKAKKIKKHGGKRRKMDEHENVSPTRPYVPLESTTPRQPCRVQNFNRMTRNSAGVDNQFNWEKVLSSDPERQLKRKHQPTQRTPRALRPVDQASVVKACYVRNQEPTESEQIPTPAMNDVINRKGRTTPSLGRKGKSRSSSPESWMSPLGPNTPEMNRVLRLYEKRKQFETTEQTSEDDGSALPLRSGKKRLANKNISRLKTKLNKSLLDNFPMKKKKVAGLEDSTKKKLNLRRKR